MTLKTWTRSSAPNKGSPHFGRIPSCPVAPFFLFCGNGSPLSSTNPKKHAASVFLPWKPTGHLRIRRLQVRNPGLRSLFLAEDFLAQRVQKIRQGAHLVSEAGALLAGVRKTPNESQSPGFLDSTCGILDMVDQAVVGGEKGACCFFFHGHWVSEYPLKYLLTQGIRMLVGAQDESTESVPTYDGRQASIFQPLWLLKIDSTCPRAP